MIAAILLAAGRSSRMNYPKPLLEWRGRTLLEHQMDQLARLPVAEIIVVLGHETDRILEKVSSHDQRVSFIICDDFQEGLSASLKCGLQHAEGKYDSVLLMLVDLPLIQPGTFEQVCETGAQLQDTFNEPFVVQPICHQQPGHPVFIGHFEQLNWHSLQGDLGAKPLIKQMKNRILLESEDRGVVFDIDTPQAYMEAIKIEEVRK
ncbi:NTP transferase domain-containing protein [Bacillus sp. FJAT-29814]|uniref:nucleotidyltransferase family protein n=1 Tax=Bacillus sp. FJAT-29814 TaxID=1729688 RepID=UPI00082BBE53|nr:nucleotidyltransferase family protein [Bacillus sp. FJAT-29814]